MFSMDTLLRKRPFIIFIFACSFTVSFKKKVHGKKSTKKIHKDEGSVRLEDA